ncbi:hypothetical protein JZ751_012206 [Albula glossodonta]|uniref:THAP domain-containing protein 1 n=1 Tax=Albula glossodonta TaxID=121402 RepID=A0A8T2PRQ7_9TELE|nr:hypothetical protein JZ751_012206 [Albula glossodonta]
MVQSCSAYGCKNRYHKDKNISFHKFPLARPDEEVHEDTDLPEMDFPMVLPLPDSEQTETLQPEQSEQSHPQAEVVGNSDPLSSTSISCDHNYTVEDTVQQKKRIEQLEEQVEKLRKKLKTVQQKCRRQERQMEKLKAMGEFYKASKDPALGESYVILPKELYDVLKGIESINGL